MKNRDRRLVRACASLATVATLLLWPAAGSADHDRIPDAVAPGQQPGRRANTSVHTRTIDESPKVPSPIPAAPTQPHL